jgi:hypothetical protein
MTAPACPVGGPAEPVIVGRDAECVRLSDFLDAGAHTWPAPAVNATVAQAAARTHDRTEVAAILTGPAGIGKNGPVGMDG